MKKHIPHTEHIKGKAGEHIYGHAGAQNISMTSQMAHPEYSYGKAGAIQ